MSTLKIFIHLLKTDLIQMIKDFKDSMVNLIIWAVCTIFINVYVMQKMGLSHNYSDLIIGGMVVSVISFQTIPRVVATVSDFCGDRHIQYHLILPISNKLFFLKSVCTHAINGFIFGILGLILCKVMLFHTMDLTKISILHFVIALSLSSLFFGAFTLWAISITKHPGKIGNVINRILFPLWFLGGFLFSWSILYQMLPTLAVLNLLNPYVHMTEILRGSTIGFIGFLPFWPSCGALVIIATFLGIWGFHKIKRRLDFI